MNGWIDNPASAGAKPATLDSPSVVTLFPAGPRITHVCFGFVLIVLIMWAIGRFS